MAGMIVSVHRGKRIDISCDEKHRRRMKAAQLVSSSVHCLLPGEALRPLASFSPRQTATDGLRTPTHRVADIPSAPEKNRRDLP